METHFVVTPESERLLCGERKTSAEYIVANPLNIEVELKSGDVSRPQEIRERVVRCRDCAYASPCPLSDSEKLMCAFHDETFVNPDDFCSWGKERDA